LTIWAGIAAGEPFGLRELVGVLLISGAALVEGIWTSGRPGGLPLLVRRPGGNEWPNWRSPSHRCEG
jgi:hypothetical protein